MTDDKIEAAAREAAIDHGEWLEADADETNCDSFVAGFKAGHASRDAEIAEKDAEIAALRAKLASMREPLWMLREEHEAETAELRSRLEAE